MKSIMSKIKNKYSNGRTNGSLNLKNYIIEHHHDEVIDIINMASKSTLPGRNNFKIITNPYNDYPNIIPTEIEAILLFPTTVPHRDVLKFLKERILIIPISFLGYLADKERKEIKWSECNNTYQAYVRSFFNIAEMTSSYIIQHNPSLVLIGMDEFGRVLISKYIRHPIEFIHNPVDNFGKEQSLSDKHLNDLLEKIKVYQPVINSSNEETLHEKFKLPKLHENYYMEIA